MKAHLYTVVTLLVLAGVLTFILLSPPKVIGIAFALAAAAILYLMIYTAIRSTPDK